MAPEMGRVNNGALVLATHRIGRFVVSEGCVLKLARSLFQAILFDMYDIRGVFKVCLLVIITCG